MTGSRRSLAATTAALVAGALVVGCGQPGGRRSPQSPGSHPSAKASPSASPTSATTSLTLNVDSLPTTYGVPGSRGTYPATVRVSVPTSLAGAVAAYGVGGTVVVGPTAWTGSGQVGADGGIAFTLTPTGGASGSGDGLVFEFDGGCAGCSWDDASAYFPAVASALPSAGAGAAASPPPGLETESLGAGLIGYSEPAATTELQVNGVAYTNLPAATASPIFENLTVTLPPSGHALATAILNAFVTGQDRYVCPSGLASPTTNLILGTGTC